jgi:flagellar protein FlbD
MITLTKLDGQPVVINEDQLVFAEKTPDTVITMASGQRLMVRERLDELVARSEAFRRGCLSTSAGEAAHG